MSIMQQKPAMNNFGYSSSMVVHFNPTALNIEYQEIVILAYIRITLYEAVSTTCLNSLQVSIFCDF